MDLCLEQANIFSAIMGMFGTNALDAVSDYEKHRDSFTAQQRFPDLGRRGTRKPLKPNDSLESKTSTRNYAIQSHYDHPGWYIVWRYLVDPTETGKPRSRRYAFAARQAGAPHTRRNSEFCTGK